MNAIPDSRFPKGEKLLRKYSLSKFLAYLERIGSEESDKNHRVKLMFVGDENQGECERKRKRKR